MEEKEWIRRFANQWEKISGDTSEGSLAAAKANFRALGGSRGNPEEDAIAEYDAALAMQ